MMPCLPGKKTPRAVGKTGAERLTGAGFPADCRGQGGQSAGISAENLLPHFVKQFRLCVFNRQCPPRQRRFRRLIGYILGAGRQPGKSPAEKAEMFGRHGGGGKNIFLQNQIGGARQEHRLVF